VFPRTLIEPAADRRYNLRCPAIEFKWPGVFMTLAISRFLLRGDLNSYAASRLFLDSTVSLDAMWRRGTNLLDRHYS